MTISALAQPQIFGEAPYRAQAEWKWLRLGQLPPPVQQPGYAMPLQAPLGAGW